MQLYTTWYITVTEKNIESSIWLHQFKNQELFHQKKNKRKKLLDNIRLTDPLINRNPSLVSNCELWIRLSPWLCPHLLTILCPNTLTLLLSPHNAPAQWNKHKPNQITHYTKWNAYMIWNELADLDWTKMLDDSICKERLKCAPAHIFAFLHHFLRPIQNITV